MDTKYEKVKLNTHYKCHPRKNNIARVKVLKQKINILKQTMELLILLVINKKWYMN